MADLTSNNSIPLYVRAVEIRVRDGREGEVLLGDVQGTYYLAVGEYVARLSTRGGATVTRHVSVRANGEVFVQ